MIYLSDLNMNDMNPAVKAQIKAALQEQEKNEAVKDNGVMLMFLLILWLCFLRCLSLKEMAELQGAEMFPQEH